MFLNLFKYLNKKILFVILFITAPLINADWFALNMTRGITDISNEVFELHMLIFLDLCSDWRIGIWGYVLFNVRTQRKKNPVPATFDDNHKLR